MRPIWLIAKSVLLEGLRRRELYAMACIACLLIALVMTVDFFNVEGLNKFYRETALKIMSLTSALTVIFLSCRQLPREFEMGTIQILLSKPISRSVFLLGKWGGVLLTAAFCLFLFMSVYVVGATYLGGEIPWALFAQHCILQMTLFFMLSSLCFLLSLVLNLDAAVVVACLLYLLASVFMNATSFIYFESGALGKALALVGTYVMPQLSLFNLSGKVTHADIWPPIGLETMIGLVLYGSLHAGLYFGVALKIFSRRRV